MKKKILSVILTAAVMTLMAAGCGNSETASQTPQSSDEMSSQEAAESPEETSSDAVSETADSEFLSLRANRYAQQDGGYYYFMYKNQVCRVAENGTGSCEILFTLENNSNIYGYEPKFAVKDEKVYVLDTIYDDSNGSYQGTLYMIRPDSDGGEWKSEIQDTLDGNSFNHLSLFEGELVLSEGTNDGTLIREYKILEDGTLSQEDGEIKKAADTLTTEQKDLIGYTLSDSHYSLPFMLKYYGDRIYIVRYDEGNAVGEYQSLLTEIGIGSGETRDIAEIAGTESVEGYTEKYAIVMNDETYGRGGDVSLIDLESGEKKTIFEPGSAYGKTGFLDNDETFLYLVAEEAGTPQDEPPVWDLLQIGLDGTTKTLASYREPIDDHVDGDGIFSANSFGLVPEGCFYLRYADYVKNAFLMDVSGNETALSEQPVFDTGLKAAGITFNRYHSIERYQENGIDKEIAAVDFMIPQISESDEAAQKFNQECAGWSTSADDFLSQAKSDFEDMVNYEASSVTGDSGDITGLSTFMYTWDRYYSDTLYDDDSVISFCLTGYQYTGGAHGGGDNFYYNYDKKNKRMLSLSDVVGMDTDAFMDVLSDCIQNDENFLSTYNLFDSPENTAAQIRENYPDMNELNWFITEDGIGIQFDEYEIAPYAAGMPVIIIPSEKLGG